MHSLIDYQNKNKAISREQALRILSNEKGKNIVSHSELVKSVTPLAALVGKAPSPDEPIKLIKFVDNLTMKLRATGSLDQYLSVEAKKNPILHFRQYMIQGNQLPNEIDQKLQSCFKSDQIVFSLLYQVTCDEGQYRRLNERSNPNTVFAYQRFIEFLKFIGFRQDTNEDDPELCYSPKVSDILHNTFISLKLVKISPNSSFDECLREYICDMQLLHKYICAGKGKDISNEMARQTLIKGLPIKFAKEVEESLQLATLHGITNVETIKTSFDEYCDYLFEHQKIKQYSTEQFEDLRYDGTSSGKVSLPANTSLLNNISSSSTTIGNLTDASSANQPSAATAAGANTPVANAVQSANNNGQQQFGKKARREKRGNKANRGNSKNWNNFPGNNNGGGRGFGGGRGGGRGGRGGGYHAGRFNNQRTNNYGRGRGGHHNGNYNYRHSNNYGNSNHGTQFSNFPTNQSSNFDQNRSNNSAYDMQWPEEARRLAASNRNNDFSYQDGRQPGFSRVTIAAQVVHNVDPNNPIYFMDTAATYSHRVSAKYLSNVKPTLLTIETADGTKHYSKFIGYIGNLQFVVVPTFKFNLISVKEISFLFNWKSTFDKHVCIVTDVQNREVFRTINLGNDRDQLYYIDELTLNNSLKLYWTRVYEESRIQSLPMANATINNQQSNNGNHICDSPTCHKCDNVPTREQSQVLLLHSRLHLDVSKLSELKKYVKGIDKVNIRRRDSLLAPCTFCQQGSMQSRPYKRNDNET